MGLRKAGGNYVEGDRFFDRDAEIEALMERVEDGTHTLLTAQRRMGKTSLARELLRRLADEGRCETIFVDLEAASVPADAITEIWFQSASAQGSWGQVKSLLANTLSAVGRIVRRIPAPAGEDLWMQIRAGIDAGNWRHKGDRLFDALAEGEPPVVLAIDELPIFVNRLLKGNDYRITPKRKRAADEFLSWLRDNGQTHKGRICMIVSGSVSLEPILRQAGLSAHANIFSPFDLQPWDEETAAACLGALGETYGLDLPHAVREDMCRRLRCQIPHHVQRFFDILHEDLRPTGRRAASLEDVERVYVNEMLGVRGQMDMEHYEGRLKMVLGEEGCRIALEMLTDAAVSDDGLRDDAIDRYRESLAAGAEPVEDILRTLEHDGYLERQGDGYRFVSGLLEDWWRVRYGRGSRR